MGLGGMDYWYFGIVDELFVMVCFKWWFEMDGCLYDVVCGDGWMVVLFWLVVGGIVMV